MARSKYTDVEINMIKDISNNIQRLLDLKGLTQTYLCDKTGLSSSTISDYVKGRTLVPPGNLQKIAEALNVSITDLNTSLGEKHLHNTIPLVGTICAGKGLLAEQNIEDNIYYPLQGKCQPDYALRVKGDSMTGAGIESGDIVFMRYAQWADHNGQIVAVLINNDEDGTLKRIKWSEGSPNIQLVPENSDHKIIECLPNEVRICGIYMGHFRPMDKE